MKYRDIKDNITFKHVLDIDNLKTYAIMKKVSNKLVRNIVNCGFIEYDDEQKIKAIYHCDCMRHLDTMELVVLWSRGAYLDNLERNIVKKRRRYIQNYFKNFKILHVNKSLNESNIYFMFSQNLPCMLNRDQYIKILNIRTFKSGADDLDYFETKIKINSLY